MNERKEFEKLCAGKRSVALIPEGYTQSGQYLQHGVQFAWFAWQNAKMSAAQEIESLRDQLKEALAEVAVKDKQIAELELCEESNVLSGSYLVSENERFQAYI